MRFGRAIFAHPFVEHSGSRVRPARSKPRAHPPKSGSRRAVGLSLPLLTLSIALAAPLAGCDGSPSNTGSGGGGGGTGGTGGGVQLGPGEVCYDPSANNLKLRAEPAFVVVPSCADGASCVGRAVNVVLDPDVCKPAKLTFTSSDAAVIEAPAEAEFDLHRPVVPLVLRGGKDTGAATITATVDFGNGTPVTAEIAVEVLAPDALGCAGVVNADPLAAGTTLAGEDGLVGATLSLPEDADRPNENSFIWSVQPFPAEIACGEDLATAADVALGPAIRFGPEEKVFPREIPMSIPINPALLPEKARWRHMEILYSGPAFEAPRTVPVTDVHVAKVNGQWAVSFQAPRLGTYQAVVKKDAGNSTFSRRLTHKAVIGVSMGGGGTATFGLRHHDRFDVLAPLGGPVDWTWLLWHIENNHLGGFRPIAPGTTLGDIQQTSTPCDDDSACLADERCVGVIEGTQQGRCAWMPVPKDPYEHPSTFNTWWYEYPKTGNGGSFSREDYSQIFRDLGLMFGNPNAENLTPGAENLPAGVRPDDPSVIGDHPNEECAVWVDPLDGPDKEKQDEIKNNCPVERCNHTLTLSSYFDDEYNPDGAFPVITVCDGSPQNSALTPYSNTWTPNQNDYPLEVGLAVDYNGNGVRDEMEPILRAGHEPWQDAGEDGKFSVNEAGYAVGMHEDPEGDDYQPQYNPRGTEGDHRYTAGEPYSDSGLDGVPGTPQQPAGGWQQPGDGYDVGEGDGQFTACSGLNNFWERDSHSIVRQWSKEVPGGDLDDEALRRIDVWTDGGTRDLFNFAVDAQHLVGAFAARGRQVTYLSDFTRAPGLDPSMPNNFLPPNIVYEDMPGIVFQRYGHTDPSQKDIDQGSGQHVGTAAEIASRLQTALYFIGSRWPEPELRQFVEESKLDPDPDAEDCEVDGNCTFEFTSSFGRKGPVGVTLPPGYANAKQKSRRYPVIYMLHGYGQTPEDLGAAIIFLRNWMNSPLDGMGSRLPKAILVYVDGRCRVTDEGRAECIRGTFYTDSVRAEGVQDESWWLELMDHVDSKYRTMGESAVDWTE